MKKKYKCFMDFLLDNNFNCENIKTFKNIEINKKYNYLCKICNMKFTRNDHLKRHIHTIHLKDKIYTCLYCFKSFLQERLFDVA